MFWLEKIEPRHEMDVNGRPSPIKRRKTEMSEREELQTLRQMVIVLQAQIADQQKTSAERDAEIENLNIHQDRFLQALRHAQKKIYGPSSEKMSQKMSLFEENEKQITFAKELSKNLEMVTVTKKNVRKIAVYGNPGRDAGTSGSEGGGIHTAGGCNLLNLRR